MDTDVNKAEYEGGVYYSDRNIIKHIYPNGWIWIIEEISKYEKVIKMNKLKFQIAMLIMFISKIIYDIVHLDFY